MTPATPSLGCTGPIGSRSTIRGRSRCAGPTASGSSRPAVTGATIRAIDRLQAADFRPLYRPIEGYRSEIEDDGLGQAKAAVEAREDAFTNGRLTFDWRSHAVDLDLA
jgi:hypothetical protein